MLLLCVEGDTKDSPTETGYSTPPLGNISLGESVPQVRNDFEEQNELSIVVELVHPGRLSLTMLPRPCCRHGSFLAAVQ